MNIAKMTSTATAAATMQAMTVVSTVPAATPTLVPVPHGLPTAREMAEPSMTITSVGTANTRNRVAST